MRPERIEIEIEVAAAILRLIAEIFRPVRAIGDLAVAADLGPHFSGKRAEMRDKGKALLSIANAGQPAQFRPEKKAVHATGLAGQIGAMVEKAAIAPWPINKGLHLFASGRCLVRRTGNANGRMTGDAPAPGISGLANAA